LRVGSKLTGSISASRKNLLRLNSASRLLRVNLHRGKIEDAVVRAVIHDDDGIKLQVDVVGLDLTALIDTRRVVE